MANSQYNNGTTSTYGANLTLHASDRVGIMAANDQRIYRQFASKKFTLPQRMVRHSRLSESKTSMTDN